MLRASPVRLSVFTLLSATGLMFICLAGTEAAAAGTGTRYHSAHRGPVVGYHPHGSSFRPVHRTAYLHHRRTDRLDGKYSKTRFYPGAFGYPYAYGVPGAYALSEPAFAGDQGAAPVQRQLGPVSFADLPASTGIRPAPSSQPLFIRVNGRQTVADDGEKHLWRAGPQIVNLDGTGIRRVAKQPRQARFDTAAQNAPKIIVIRP